MLPSADLTASEKVLLLRFEVDTDSLQLSKLNLQNLNEACKGRDVIVTLDGKESTKSSIYWRGKGFKHFVALEPFCDETTNEQSKLYQFIIDFLVRCLSNGQSGMNN